MNNSEGCPHELVGGKAELMGPWQLNTLKALGLLPHHKLLDLGCGTLRGGGHLIDYLETGRYVGVDPSSRLLSLAQDFIDDARALKSPHIVTLEDMVFAPAFDFVWAQSVINHLEQPAVDVLAANISEALNLDGVWSATAQLGGSIPLYGPPHAWRPDERVYAVYPISLLSSIFFRHGLSLHQVTPERAHPGGLDVICGRHDLGAHTRALDILERLIGLDTSTPGAQTAACVSFLESVLVKLGFDVEVISGDKPLIVARREATHGARGHLCVYNHYDVDEPHGQWSVDPWSLTSTQGRLHGVGIADNKGALSARLVALDTQQPCPALTWIIQGEEESGSALMSRWMAQQSFDDVSLWLDENGWRDADGTQRILSVWGQDDVSGPNHLPFHVHLSHALMPGGGARRVERRMLNKSLAPVPCPFQEAVDGLYLGIGINDGQTKIHAPDESISARAIHRHILQLRALLQHVAVGALV